MKVKHINPAEQYNIWVSHPVRMAKKITFHAAFFALILCYYGCKGDQLTSPDGNINVKIHVEDSVYFSVFFRDELILRLSPLDFTFKDAQPLGKGLEIHELKQRVIHESWKPVLKKEETVIDHCSEAVYCLTEKMSPYRKVRLTARVYDDGFAYRTEFLKSGYDSVLIIMDEKDMFTFTADHHCWAADYSGYQSSQEGEFVKRNLSGITDPMVIGLPVTVKINDSTWVALTEAMLVDYPGMYLKRADTRSGYSLRSQLAPLPGQDENGEKARIALPHKTPWRVIMIGKTPGRLIESNIIVNLNEPCQWKDISWIRPGMCAWDHWWSGDVNATTEAIRDYIDLAAEMDWPYQLIDWQWYGVPRTSRLFKKDSDDITRAVDAIDLPGVLDYAKRKGVRCWLWLHWRDLNRHNIDTVFTLYKAWGIAGVKIDFMNRDDQEMVNWYEKVMKTAAKYQLMIIFHSSFKPTGTQRTYPHVLTTEGVLGNEYNKESARVTPEHMVTIPFTRMLAGPMDFTPGGFLNRLPVNFVFQPVPATVQGSRCNTLAQFVVYESPLTIACDHPEHYRNQPGTDFLKSFPTIWDRTVVLNGSIGEFITIARRSGDRWYLGAMNNSIPRELELKMSFLDDGNYQMMSYADFNEPPANPMDLIKSTDTINRNTTLRIFMNEGGGFAARIIPLPENQ